jgi:hypothetical protein
MALFPKLQHWLPALYATSVQGEFVSFSDNEGIDNKLALFNDAGRKHLPYLQSMMTGTASETTHKKLLDSFSRNLKKGVAPAQKKQPVRTSPR